MLDFRSDDHRDIARTSAAEAGRDRDVLMAARAERNRKTLHRGAEARLPEHLASSHVMRTKVAIEISDEGQAARRGQHPRQIGGALLVAPDLLQSLDVVGGQLADVAVAAGHFEETP